MRMIWVAGLVAMWADASVGSAYAGPTVGIPGPIAGAGIAGLIAAGLAGYAWYYRRRKQQ